MRLLPILVSLLDIFLGMNTILFLTLFSALGALYFYLGIRASKKVTTDDDYYIANSQLGIWQISSNLIATQARWRYAARHSRLCIQRWLLRLILYDLAWRSDFSYSRCGIAARLQQFHSYNHCATYLKLNIIQYSSKRLLLLLSIITLVWHSHCASSRL